jgi:hypothetical protein
MSQDERIDALKAKHHALDTVIDKKLQNCADELEISDLKKQKLRIKDELVELTAR